MSKHIPRIYIEHITVEQHTEVPAFHINHLLHVLRIKIGDPIIVFNQRVGEWSATVVKTGNNKVTIKCLKQLRCFTNSHKICLAFGIIKPDRLSWMLEKSVELGATDLFPLLTEYTNFRTINQTRYVKTIISAVEQSHRLDIPTLHPILTFDHFINTLDHSINWHVAIERLDHPTSHIKTGDCGFIIGPEGGFSDREKKLLSTKIQPINLSKNILRTETAAVACLAIKEAIDHWDTSS